MKRIKVDFNNIARGGQLVTYTRHQEEELKVGEQVLGFTGDPEPDNEEVICVVVSIEPPRIYLDPDWRS